MIETLAGIAAIALLGLALRWERRRRKWQSAHDYLQGYSFGYDDGSSGKIRAFSGELPEAFRKSFR